MPADSSTEFAEVLARIRCWSAEWRLGLAEAILRTLHPVIDSGEARGVPAEKVRGMAAGPGPAPDDDTVRRWIDEQRLEKHG
jgi:hypothetical protein